MIRVHRRHRQMDRQISCLQDNERLACDDCISVVVEGTAEDLIGMTIKHLFTQPSLRVPQTSRLVNAGCQNLRPLRVETYLHNQQLII